MEKQHFEILLEEMKSNFRLAFEGFEVVNNRLDRLESGQETLKSDVTDVKMHLTRVEDDQKVIKSNVKEVKLRLVRVEDGQNVVKSDVRDIKRNMGLINSIASDHETRIQKVENSLQDHLANHR